MTIEYITRFCTMINNDPSGNENESQLIGNILAEDNSGMLIKPSLHLIIDSDGDDQRTQKMQGYTQGYQLG